MITITLHWTVWLILALAFSAAFWRGVKSMLSGREQAEEMILLLLEKWGAPMYGLQMVELSGGTLKRGTIYLHLTRLQERGMIEKLASEGTGCSLYRLSRIY